MPQKRNALGNVLLFFKGMAMGAADVVPGVSGGTIAFISGIYQELLGSIASLKVDAFKTLKSEGLKAAWAKINGGFFVVLLAGIMASIVLLAGLIEYLLEAHPIPLWSFFFGLVVASVFLVGGRVKKWSIGPIIGIVAGSVVAYLITLSVPVGEVDSLPYLFLCGAIAITAMILPGISGSFILLLLGAYTTVLGAVNSAKDALSEGEWDGFFSSFLKLLVFATGCIVGLLGFSRILNWLFKKAHNITVAVLAGFLIGSLNKLWPWKENLEYFIKHVGEPNEEKVPTVQRNILPETFENLMDRPAQLGIAVALCVGGAAIIFVLSRFSPDEE